MLVIIPMDGLALSLEALRMQWKSHKQHAFLPANELALKTYWQACLLICNVTRL